MDSSSQPCPASDSTLQSCWGWQLLKTFLPPISVHTEAKLPRADHTEMCLASAPISAGMKVSPLFSPLWHLRVFTNATTT